MGALTRLLGRLLGGGRPGRTGSRTHRPCPHNPHNVHVNRYGQWECRPRTGLQL